MLDRETVHASLLQKGFREENRDHKYFTYWASDGRKTSVFTYTSFGTKYKTLGNDLIKAMSKQCRLTMPLFRELVECSMNRQQYEAHLVQGQHIRLN